jgi:CHAD domain-containing protein
MPGPFSAPNGNKLATMTEAARKGIRFSGKTDLKRGRIGHKTKLDSEHRLKKEMKRWRDLNEE